MIFAKNEGAANEGKSVRAGNRVQSDHDILPEGWPMYIAHRGASSVAPENTLAAFRRARDFGCAGIELDVHLCASGELVVTHDHWLDRIGGVHRRVEEMSLDEIRTIDAGSFFNRLHPELADPSFADERIPTLDEVLDAVGDGMYLDIELKLEGLWPFPLASAVARRLKDRGRSRCIVSSFNPLALLAYRACGPHRTAAIYCPYDSVPFLARHRECLYLSGADIKKPAIETALASPSLETGTKPVIVWTVDSRDEARRLFEGGVRSVITNRIQDFCQG